HGSQHLLGQGRGAVRDGPRGRRPHGRFDCPLHGGGLQGSRQRRRRPWPCHGRSQRGTERQAAPGQPRTEPLPAPLQPALHGPRPPAESPGRPLLPPPLPPPPPPPPPAPS